MPTRIGFSCGLNENMVSLEAKAGEVRRYWYEYPNFNYWKAAKKCIDNNIYLIFNQSIGWSGPGLEHFPTEWEWRTRIEENVKIIISLGANKNNCRLTLINEATKYIKDVNKLVWLINIAHDQIGGRFELGAGNCEFIDAQVYYGGLESICRNANFEWLDLHIQGSCQTESDTSRWTEYALNIATTYHKKLDCIEANIFDVASMGGYKKLLMQLKYAEKIGCKNFLMVFMNFYSNIFSFNTDHWKKLCFIWNGKVRNKNNWNDFVNIINKKAPVPEPVIEGDEDMILVTMKRGVRHPAVRWLQQILEEDYGVANDYGKYDGDFGPATERQVKAYQKKIGVSETGIIRATDIIKIYEDSSDTALWFRRLESHASYR